MCFRVTESPAGRDELRASIELFFDEYGQAFSSLNAESVVSFFAMPFYVELDGDPVVWTGPKDPASYA